MEKAKKRTDWFEAAHYRDAAREHIGTARQLHEEIKSYPVAIYISGLATECMLRAYKRLITDELDEKHDLPKLFRNSKIIEYLPSVHQVDYGEYLGVVVTNWNNLHRYRSDALMRSWFKKHRLDRGIKGDFLKEISRKIFDASFEMVTLGEKKWPIKL